MRQLRAGDPVFGFDPGSFRKLWWVIVKFLGIAFVGPPHNLRHSKPAADVAKRAKTLEEVRRRGRWASLTSVQRYTKDFLLIAHEAKVPESVRSRGQLFVQNPRKELCRAIKRSARPTGHLARVLLSGLDADVDFKKPTSDRPCSVCGFGSGKCACEVVSMSPAPPSRPSRSRTKKATSES